MFSREDLASRTLKQLRYQQLWNHKSTQIDSFGKPKKVTGPSFSGTPGAA